MITIRITDERCDELRRHGADLDELERRIRRLVDHEVRMLLPTPMAQTAGPYTVVHPDDVRFLREAPTSWQVRCPSGRVYIWGHHFERWEPVQPGKVDEHSIGISARCMEGRLVPRSFEESSL